MEYFEHLKPEEKKEYAIIESNGRAKFNKNIFLKHLNSHGIVIPSIICPQDSRVSFNSIKQCFEIIKKVVPCMQDIPITSSSPRRKNLLEKSIVDEILSTTVMASNEPPSFSNEPQSF